jgi:hypothetical protein
LRPVGGLHDEFLDSSILFSSPIKMSLLTQMIRHIAMLVRLGYCQTVWSLSVVLSLQVSAATFVFKEVLIFDV